MTTRQAILYARSLPLGETQRRVIRGDEDAALPELLDAFEAHLQYRRELRGGGGGRDRVSHMDASLIETIVLCRSRMKSIEFERRVLANAACRHYVDAPIPRWISDLAVGEHPNDMAHDRMRNSGYITWNNGWVLTGTGWSELNKCKPKQETEAT